jgi:hypothetical protein
MPTLVVQPDAATVLIMDGGTKPVGQLTRNKK